MSIVRQSKGREASSMNHRTMNTSRGRQRALNGECLEGSWVKDSPMGLESLFQGQ
ncbi:hypothetical protein BJX62DRAFT_213516 [Aspergillus germanicus]